jgi:hypothetical protein
MEIKFSLPAVLPCPYGGNREYGHLNLVIDTDHPELCELSLMKDGETLQDFQLTTKELDKVTQLVALARA